MYRITAILLFCISAACAMAVEKPEAHAPDLAKIKTESVNEHSPYYYPTLLKRFMSSDTAMTNEEFEYFYYGTLFQEDYDPYRPAFDEERLSKVQPLYYKSGHTRAEKDMILKYAQDAIADNPLDLLQLKNLVYVYEQNQKVNMAKIWKYKLNHLLYTIAASGTGHDMENAWYVVFPRHEFDFLNLSGITVQSSDFEPPFYERVSVNKKTEKEPDAYYFNIEPVLEQYYLKHPSEAE